MDTIVLKTKNVSEINGNFCILTYQRGYRWGERSYSA